MTYNPTLDRWNGLDRTSAAYKRSRKQERETMERLGGKQTPASGSRSEKGDGEVPEIARIECKATEADSFRVTKKMIETIERAGRLKGQMPVMDIEFVDAKGKPIYSACVIKRRDLEALIRRVQDAEGLKPATGKRGIRRLERHDRKLTKDA